MMEMFERESKRPRLESPINIIHLINEMRTAIKGKGGQRATKELLNNRQLLNGLINEALSDFYLEVCKLFENGSVLFMYYRAFKC